MGQKNNVICSYLSNPAIFADFINGSLHNGQKVLLPHQLAERNVVSHTKMEKMLTMVVQIYTIC